jgi:hypothetical protein
MPRNTPSGSPTARSSGSAGTPTWSILRPSAGPSKRGADPALGRDRRVAVAASIQPALETEVPALAGSGVDILALDAQRRRSEETLPSAASSDSTRRSSISSLIPASSRSSRRVVGAPRSSGTRRSRGARFSSIAPSLFGSSSAPDQDRDGRDDGDESRPPPEENGEREGSDRRGDQRPGHAAGEGHDPKPQGRDRLSHQQVASSTRPQAATCSAFSCRSARPSSITQRPAGRRGDSGWSGVRAGSRRTRTSEARRGGIASDASRRRTGSAARPVVPGRSTMLSSELCPVDSTRPGLSFIDISRMRSLRE